MKRAIFLLALSAASVTLTVTAGLPAKAVAAPDLKSSKVSTLRQSVYPSQRSLPHLMLPRPKRNVRRAAASIPLSYGGGPIEKSPKIYVTYWGWSSDPSHEANYLQGFLSAVGGNPWLNTVTQYSESSRGNITDPAAQFKGAWSDNSNAAPQQPTDAQIQSEALRAVKHFGFDRDALYFVATATGKSSPGFGTSYCAYHSAFGSSSGIIAYTYLPYMTDAGGNCGENAVNLGASGLLDGVSIVAGHELAESQTDPVPYSGWNASDGEIGDKCAWTNLQDVPLTNATYPMQPLWSNVAGGCTQSTTPMPLDGPDALAIDASNHLYVASGVGNEIFKYDLAFNQYPASTISQGLNAPAQLAFDPNGNLLVANVLGNSITKYGLSGTYLASQTLTQGIDKPLGLAVDAYGDVYVSNANANTVTIYNVDGKLVQTLAKDTTGRSFTSPDALRIYGENLYVGLSGTGTVAGYNVGEFLTALAKPLSAVTAGIDSPSGIAFDALGDMFVSNFVGNTVAKYSPSGKLLQTLTNGIASPSNVAIDAHGNIYVANYHLNTVSVYNSSGTLIHTIH